MKNMDGGLRMSNLNLMDVGVKLVIYPLIGFVLVNFICGLEMVSLEQCAIGQAACLFVLTFGVLLIILSECR